jgi:hypothetical protein
MIGGIIRCAFLADYANGCWSAIASAAEAAASARRWWSIITSRHNRANLLVTLCVRCHIRIHRSSGWRYWFSEMLVRLWRELHPNAPMQLQLSFRSAAKTEALLKEPRGEGRATFDLVKS